MSESNCIITGTVYDKNGNGIPNATVKLWHQNDDGQADYMIRLPSNPQYTKHFSPIGQYTFTNVPPGFYVVTVDKADAQGNIYSSSNPYCMVQTGTSTIDLIISDYSIESSIASTTTQTKIPTPTQTQLPQPTEAEKQTTINNHDLTPIPTTQPQQGGELVNGIIIGAIGIIAIIAIFAIGIYAGMFLKK